jgi:hypothetical protein
VEHLVFFLHIHSAMFLLLLMVELLEWLEPQVGPAARWLSLTESLLLLYAVYYLYRALRTYYAQGRLLTTLKLAGIASSYGVCLLLTLVPTLIISAVTM